MQRLALVIDGANASEERLVEKCVCRQLAEPVRESLRELHHLGTRVGGEQIVKGCRDRLQRLSTLLEATNRIVKGCRLTLCRDRINLCTMQRDRLLHSRAEGLHSLLYGSSGREVEKLIKGEAPVRSLGSGKEVA